MIKQATVCYLCMIKFADFPALKVFPDLFFPNIFIYNKGLPSPMVEPFQISRSAGMKLVILKRRSTCKRTGWVCGETLCLDSINSFKFQCKFHCSMHVTLYN